MKYLFIFGIYIYFVLFIEKEQGEGSRESLSSDVNFNCKVRNDRQLEWKIRLQKFNGQSRTELLRVHPMGGQ